MTIVLPNVRKLFIPDPGHFIASCDLAGADAQVVAWEAGDEDLKAAFRAGIPIHQKNAEDMFGVKAETLDDARPVGVSGNGAGYGTTGGPANAHPRHRERAGNGHPNMIYWPGRGWIEKHPEYQNCKQGQHALNYGAAAKTVAITLGWTIAVASNFKTRWFGLHPRIPQVWHKKVELELMTTRSASNLFGYRIVYFDRMRSLLPEALAWGPQSTVALCCNKGGVKLRKHLPWVGILLQVHDELVIQFPWRYEDRLHEIRDCLEVEVPYDDPLVIPWKLGLSRKSWGDCESRDWE